MLLPLVLGCTKNKTFNNKYFNLSVPAEFKIDSINLGDFSTTKYSGSELIVKNDLECYIYSFYLDHKEFRERKGIYFANTVMKNHSKKDVHEIILAELAKQKKYFSEDTYKNFELIVPLKDTIVKNQKYSYYIYSYEEDQTKIKKGRVFTTAKGKIHDIALAFNNKDNSSIKNQFNELFSIVNTITFKK